MPQRLEQERNILGESQFESDQRSVSNKFFTRLREGKRTQEENPRDHFCVYFAAFDPIAGEIFIGHHKKSGKWLFNGGHVDKGESPVRAKEREMIEEWGFTAQTEGDGSPSLRTITQIDDPKIKCKTHYDYWYFIPMNKKDFRPKEELLNKEFYSTGWKTIKEAVDLVTDPNTLLAIEQIQRRFVKS